MSKGRVSTMNNTLQEKKIKNISINKKQKKNISTKATASMSVPQKPLEHYILKRGVSNW